jgi:hypothetical protein
VTLAAPFLDSPTRRRRRHGGGVRGAGTNRLGVSNNCTETTCRDWRSAGQRLPVVTIPWTALDVLSPTMTALTNP